MSVHLLNKHSFCFRKTFAKFFPHNFRSMCGNIGGISLAASFIESHSATTLAIPAIRFTTHFETFWYRWFFSTTSRASSVSTANVSISSMTLPILTKEAVNFLLQKLSLVDFKPIGHLRHWFPSCVWYGHCFGFHFSNRVELSLQIQDELC